MTTESGWLPEQRASARAALAVIVPDEEDRTPKRPSQKHPSTDGKKLDVI